MSRWRGIVLSLIGVVAIVWLAATGQLGLYIHPRYYEFTVVMAVLAGIVVVAAFALVPGAADDHAEDDGHDHGGPVRPQRRDAIWLGATAVITAATVGALLVLPPTTLTSATVDQRDLNASESTAGDVAGSADAVDLVGSDTASFTVKDWASLLRQGAGEEYFAGKTVDVTGFVTPDTDDPENVFYVARFVVTCCAVDAQPVGVPVYAPGWQDDYEVDSWVHATGSFTTNPSTSSAQSVALQPAEITPVEQPAEPYVY
jgi:uncharacterized repeat protein (TIGR03943 family)